MSAYSCFNNINKSYVHFHRMCDFTPDELYKFTGIEPTKHERYGEGYMAFVQDHKGVQYKVQLPGKYLRRLTLPDHINEMIDDIKNSRAPYLIYRSQLKDGSYVIEIQPYTAERNFNFSRHIMERSLSVADAQSGCNVSQQLSSSVFTNDSEKKTEQSSSTDDRVNRKRTSSDLNAGEVTDTVKKVKSVEPK